MSDDTTVLAPSWTRLAAVGAAAVVVRAITTPFYHGDTRGHVVDALRVRDQSLFGGAASLWEFGDLLWRLLVWLLARLAPPAGDLQGSTWLIFITRCGAIATVFSRCFADDPRRIGLNSRPMRESLARIRWEALS